MTTAKDRPEAAALARRLLDAVERGELDADSPAGRRLQRRLEGALAAWETENAGPRFPAPGQPNELLPANGRP